MAQSILEVKGIGKVTVLILAKSGYKTVNDLAKASVDNLALIPSFSQTRAAQVINNAKELLMPVSEKKLPTQVPAESETKKTSLLSSKPKKVKKKVKKEKEGKNKKKKDKKGKSKVAGKDKKKNSKKNKDKKEKQKKSIKKSK